MPVLIEFQSHLWERVYVAGEKFRVTGRQTSSVMFDTKLSHDFSWRSTLGCNFM